MYTLELQLADADVREKQMTLAVVTLAMCILATRVAVEDVPFFILIFLTFLGFCMWNVRSAGRVRDHLYSMLIGELSKKTVETIE